MLYNIAGRTGTNIETPTLLRLAEIPNIAAVKEASGNISQIAEVCASVPEDFLVFSGDDAITLAVIGLGGVGIVSVVSNEIPAEMTRMTQAALANKWDTARAIFRKYLPLMQANFIESNPGPAKAVLAMMGRIEEIYRLPLVPMKKETRAKLEKVAADVGLLQPSRCIQFPACIAFDQRDGARQPTSILPAMRELQPQIESLYAMGAAAMMSVPAVFARFRDA